MAFYPNERIAIFIDGANLYSTMKLLDFDIDYKAMLGFFNDKGRVIKANYYTALLEDADFSPIRPLMDWLDYNGYHVISKPARQQTDRDGRARVKGNMDIEIAVDMITLAPHVDHMVLFSGDGDFAPALKAVQDKGVRVTVVSTMKARQPVLGDALRRQANDFMDIAEMDKLIGRERRDYVQYEDDE